MSRNWLRAAERYEASHRSGFIPRRKKEPARTPNLDEFLSSEEGRAAKRLLEAADTDILLSESESALSQSASVSLDETGLVKSYQVVGMAAVFTSEKPSVTNITSKEAIAFIEECGIAPGLKMSDDQHCLVSLIRRRLDELAEAAP